jgi:nitronate monooxygenase
MNKTYHEAMDGRSKDELKKDFDAATKAQDTSRSLVWAGASVGLIDRVQPAQEIMEEVGQQAVACLKRVQC